jgi:hypothetical protein
VVAEVVVTVSVPCSVRTVSVEPLMFVTVPVAPPQKAPAKPEVALENPLAHGKPKPPRPNDGGCCAADPLGVGFAAVVFASVIELARVTTNPAAAPMTTIATATPSNHNPQRGWIGGGSDGAGGGSQFGGSRFIGQEIPYCADLSKVLLTRQRNQTSGAAAKSRLHLRHPRSQGAAVADSREERIAGVQRAARSEPLQLGIRQSGPGDF